MIPSVSSRFIPFPVDTHSSSKALIASTQKPIWKPDSFRFSGQLDTEHQKILKAFRTNCPKTIQAVLKKTWPWGLSNCPYNGLHELIEVTDPSIESMKVLLRRHVLIGSQDPDRLNRTALHCYAAKDNPNPKVLAFLVINTPFVGTLDDDNKQTPMHLLLENKKTNITQELVKPFCLHTAHLQFKDKAGKSPLQIYCQRSDVDPDIVRYLIHSVTSHKLRKALKQSAIQEYRQSHPAGLSESQSNTQVILNALENIPTEQTWTEALKLRAHLTLAYFNRLGHHLLNEIRFEQPLSEGGGGG